MTIKTSLQSSIRFTAVLIALVLLASGIQASAADSFEQRYSALIKNKAHATDAVRLAELFKIRWEYNMTEYPEFATSVGYPGQNNRWTDYSMTAIKRRKHDPEYPLKVLATINRTKLSPADQLNFDLFKREMDESLEGARFPNELMPINQLGGPQQDCPETLGVLMHHDTFADYQDILARLAGISNLLSQEMVLMQVGLASNVTPPRITLRDVPQQILDQCETDPAKSSLLRPFREFPAGMATNDQILLFGEASSILTNSAAPAFKKLYDYFFTTYLSHARETIAVSDLPDGKAWYAYNVKVVTTTSMQPDVIHELGLSEVKRIRKEMDDVIASTGFKGDFKAFLDFLRTDPQFYYTNAADLLTGYRDITKRIDPQLITLFGKLPRLTYGVVPVPAYSEKSQTTAYYEGGSLVGARPGYFYANTYALNTRPKWEMIPLSLHEAVPGHHLQLSLALELEGGPEFRKYENYTGFVEGWGLYAEGLGEDMGFYKDPYAKFGRLTYEMWRAIRLVVDTGIHSQGWTRQQAIDYFIANAGKNEHDITVEVDRYIVWPGQALAYKIGELKFKELKAFAKKELGAKYSVREFHDQLLDSGTLPLDVAEKNMREWVARRKTQP